MPKIRANGVSIHYETAGAGPGLVLLHAVPFDSSLWLYQLAHFSTWFRCLAIDLRCFGRSANVTDPFTLADMASDVRVVMAAEGLDHAVIMGCSVGSKIAVEMGVNARELCQALVLVGGSVRRRVGEDQFEARIRGFEDGGIAAYYRTHLEAGLSENFRRTPLGAYVMAHFLGRAPWLDGRAVAQVFRAFGGGELESRLGEITAPTLVINGEFDNSLPNGRHTAAAIAGAAHAVIPDAGHACCIEDPAAFDALVIGFLRDQGLLSTVASDWRSVNILTKAMWSRKW